MPKFEALLFDLGNVLFEIDIPKCSKAIYDLLDPEVDKEVFREEFRMKNHALEIGELSKAVFINFILSHARKGTQALDVILAWNSMLIGMPAVHFDLLKRLKKKYKLYLLSNINAFHHPRFLEMIAEDHDITDFDSYFDQTFYSHLIGYRKPDPKTYDHVLEEVGVQPDKLFYLDDTEEHIRSAGEKGVQTQLIRDIKETRAMMEWLLV
ncbi:MAG: HAD-IA family hydrolase [Saprospiraceae bacterium]|nr:HAD-IA family hydrolase [Saprospiraceae bacterium]